MRGKGFTSHEEDRFNAKVVEWCQPVFRFWKQIVEATTMEALSQILWEADKVLQQVTEIPAKKSCEKYLKAAYNTHLWRIRDGSKSFT